MLSGLSAFCANDTGVVAFYTTRAKSFEKPVPLGGISIKRNRTLFLMSLLLMVSLLPTVAQASWYYAPTTYPQTTWTTKPAQVVPSWYNNRAFLQQPVRSEPDRPITEQPVVPVKPETPVEPNTPAAVSLTADESLMLRLINQERQKAGLNALEVDMELVRLARMKAQDILDNNYFAHTSPTYGSAATMLKNAGIKSKANGENLSKAKDASTSHMRLMASEGHRYNILYPDYTHIGIGVIPYAYGVCVAQEFIVR